MTAPAPAELHSAPTDGELVEQVRRGETTAFTRLYHRHVRRVGRILRRMLGSSSADVDDCIQQVFIDAARGLANMPKPEGFEPWLVRITVRRAFKQLKARKRMSWLISKPVLPELPRSSDNESLIALYRVLDHMPPELRVAWTLRDLEGHSVEEVADACGISRSTAKRRISAASDFLQKRFQRA